MKFTRWFFFLWAVLAIGAHAALAQQGEDWMKKPNPPRLVNDRAGVLVQSEVTDLERKLVAYDDSTSNQVAILIVKSTGDYDIAEAATRILRDWGIGTKKNNGILILVAIDDRRMRVEVGSGLEGAVPDAVAWGIVDKVLKPAFREGHYYQGLDEAADKIMQAAAGEYKGVPRSKPGSGSGGNVIGIIIIILIILFVIGRGGGGRGGGRVISRRGSSVFDAILGGMIGSSIGRGSSGGGWGGGGFGGGSSGGGGFGGFGGGSGMGGGASGSW